jgi:iron complex transport system substrate-binding protein
MTNKNVYLTIGIIVILVASIAAYVGLSNLPNSSPSPSPSATPTPTATAPSLTPTISPSSTASSTPTQPNSSPTSSPTLNPTQSPQTSPSGSPSTQTVSITVSLGSTGIGNILVDGNVVSSQTVFQWQVGSTHSLSAVSPVAGQTGTQYAWSSWSDGGAQTHGYIVPSSGATITANFKTQYQVTFTQSGLENSANGTVVTTNIGSASYSNMPFKTWVDTGTQVTYNYQQNVSTTVVGAFFTLSNTSTSNSVTATGPVTITGAYAPAIIDYVGNVIHLPPPSQIHRVADAWAAHNTIVVMVGAREKLVATVPGDTIIPMFQKIYPPIQNMTAPFDTTGNTVNLEQLLGANPDIVFVSATNEPIAKTLEQNGFTVVRLNFLNFTDMTKTVQLTGFIFGDDALNRANQFVSYFNQVNNNVTAVTSQIPTEQKPKVLHLAGTGANPLVIDGTTTLIDTWINTCGGINAASTVSGNGKTVSLEQILAWNPDVILIGSAQANQLKSQILSDSRWSQINAVKNGKVIANPMGVFDWSRYSVEEAMNLQWVSKTLYPEKFPNIDIRAQTRYFYQTFYEYTLTDAQIDSILNNTALP